MNQAFRRQVRQVLESNHWELVVEGFNENAFVEDVLAEVEARQPKTQGKRSPDQIVHAAVVNRYGHLWYTACHAAHPLQTRALEEVFAYAYRVATYRLGDENDARDCAQHALVKIWEHLHQVKDAGAFMQWIKVIVIRTAIKDRRWGTRRIHDADTGETAFDEWEIALTDLEHSAQEGDDQVEYRRLDNPLQYRETPMMLEQARTQIEEAIRNCLPNTDQQTAVIRLLLDHEDYSTVAEELGTSLQNVYLLKNRALAHLRKCKAFVDVLEDLV